MSLISTIVIIPARSGSKSIRDKNIQKIGSKSLLQHSIDFSYQLHNVDRVLVSTDSPIYASIARRAGAWVPFLRPDELSSDLSKDLETMRHATAWIKNNTGDEVVTVVWVRPSYPLRDPGFVNHELQRFLSENNSCSARSIRLASETPYKMWQMESDKQLIRVAGSFEDDFHNSPRQILPNVYWQDGYIDFYRNCYIHGLKCPHYFKICGLLTPLENQVKDIDHKSDFERIQVDIADDSIEEFRNVQQSDSTQHSS